MERKEALPLRKLYYDPSSIGRLVYPRAVWRSRRGILLTFDDGPEPASTPEILSLLEKKGISAVFFCTGANLLKSPEVARETLNRGHTLGIHGYDHRNMLIMKKADILGQISRTGEVFRDIGIEQPKYFRPPFGLISPFMIGSLQKFGVQTVLWSMLTCDYLNDSNIVKFSIRNYLNLESLVVFHDRPSNLETTLSGIDYLTETAAEKKIKIGIPAECLN